MRLRLDKLVLSAGLALAMVATAIPVIPTKAQPTTEANYYVGTTKYDENFIAEKLLEKLQITKGLKTTDGSNITITAGNITSATSAEQVTPGETANVKVANYKIDNSFTTMEQIESIPSAITVSQPFTYALADVTVTVSADTNGTAAKEDDPLTTETNEAAEAVAPKTTERDAAVDAIIAELNALGIGTFSKGEVTGLVAGTGSYKVGVSYAPPKKTTSTDYGSSTYSGVAPLTLNVSAVNTETKKATIDLESDTFVATRNYTITNLSAVGATYKIDGGDTSVVGKQYTLLKVSTDGTIEEVKTVFGTSEASELTADVTDLSYAYYLATKTVSTSDKLIFDKTDTDEVATITQVAEPTPEGKTGIAESIESNSFTPVSYFTITLKSNKSYSDTPITFKIAVPVDVDSNVTYKVLRFHEGNVDILDTTVTDGYIYFTTDKFSDYALVTVAAAEDPTQEEQQQEEQQQESATTPEGSNGSGSSSSSSGSSAKTADNSMMPLFMTTLLLALCAGSLAIYKEKKTN